jgi:hypothetical protein
VRAAALLDNQQPGLAVGPASFGGSVGVGSSHAAALLVAGENA